MSSSAQMVLDFKKSGNEAFQAGRYQEAIAMYSMAIELDPTNEVLFSNRSAAFCKGGKHDQAMDDADTALRLKPKWARAISRKAAALEGLGKDKEALDTYTEALREDPASEVVKKAVESLTMKMEQKRQDWRDANSADAVKARQLQEDGNSAKREGELEKALACYEEALQCQKDADLKAALHSNISAVQLLAGDARAALASAEAAIELRPGWAKGHSRCAAAHYNLGDLANARGHYERALTHADEKAAGELQKMVHRIDDEMRLQQRREADPNAPDVVAEACKKKGNDLLRGGDYAAAAAAYSEGLEADPTNHILYCNRSAAHLSAGDAEQALLDAQTTVQLAPDFAKGYARKGAAIEHLAGSDVKRLLGALRAYNDAVEHDADAYSDKATALEARIDELQAAAERKQAEADQKARDSAGKFEENLLGTTALVAVPAPGQGNQLAIVEEPEVLGDKKFDAEDYRGAIGYYTQAIKAEPRRLHLYLKRGICWSKVRRYQKALSDFDLALEVNASDPEAMWQKANTLIALAGAEAETDPMSAGRRFDGAIALFTKGGGLDSAADKDRFEEALRHATNEKIAFDVLKPDRLKLLERTTAKTASQSKLDWKNMSAEEKKRRTDDMKRKAQDALFDDAYLGKQLRKGNLKQVGLAQAKKKAKKFHSGVAAKYTYTENGP
ncbi:Hsp70-Hsp90 organizing protein 3 [Diplonema papillatum]|nr:Hsp70-Hsp90 organizing protein 3 [Diplonema papillatum]